MQKMIGISVALVCLCAALLFAQNNEALTMKKSNKKTPAAEVAVIKTTKGEMVVEFWPDVAPGTVENFKKLAGEKFYDGT